MLKVFAWEKVPMLSASFVGGGENKVTEGESGPYLCPVSLSI